VNLICSYILIKDKGILELLPFFSKFWANRDNMNADISGQSLISKILLTLRQSGGTNQLKLMKVEPYVVTLFLGYCLFPINKLKIRLIFPGIPG